MSDSNNFENNQEQNSAPNVSKISLDELNEIKKTIAPVHSKSEEEMLASNPDIDPNTVYSTHIQAPSVQETEMNSQTPSVPETEMNSQTPNMDENIENNSQLQDEHAENLDLQNSEVSKAVEERYKLEDIEYLEPIGVFEDKKIEENSASNKDENNSSNRFNDLIESLRRDIERFEITNQNKQSSEPLQNENESKTQDVVDNSNNNLVEETPSVQNDTNVSNAVEENLQTQASVSNAVEESLQTQTNEQTQLELQEQPKKRKQSLFASLFGKKEKGIVETKNIPSDNTAALQAEAEAPKTEKVDLSELQAVKDSMKQEQEGLEQGGDQTVRRPSISELISSINNKDKPVEETEDNIGIYDKHLDFEKVTDIKKFKLPLPKLPFILAACFIFLIGLGVGIGFIISNNKKNQVYIVSTKFNVTDVVGGYIGETLDLSGVYIKTTYSDGTYEIITNVKDYIIATTSTIDSDTLVIKSANNMSGISCLVNGKRLQLTTVTLDNTPNKLDVKLTIDKVKDGDIIYYDQILAKVQFGVYGVKLLSIDEIKECIKISYKDYGVAFSETEDGDGVYVNALGNDASTVDELTFTYRVNNVRITDTVSIDIQDDTAA